MDKDYWRKQDPKQPLFPDVEWSRPEQQKQRGKLLIVGGSAHGMAAVGKAYAAAQAAGAGVVRVALPDALKKSLPADIDGVFLPTNPSGGLARSGTEQLRAAADWADGVLLVGDSGGNSETAVLFEDLLDKTDKWVTITRDAVDLTRNMGEKLTGRDRTNLIITFAQAQKLFQSVYYPKILTFSMQFSAVIEALHKFTITYPVTITILHQDQWAIASGGGVVTQAGADTRDLVDGSMAARAASYLLWNRTKPIEAIATSLIS